MHAYAGGAAQKYRIKALRMADATDDREHNRSFSQKTNGVQELTAMYDVYAAPLAPKLEESSWRCRAFQISGPRCSS